MPGVQTLARLGLISVVCIVLLAMGAGAFAASDPAPLPGAYYGTVTITDEPAPDGTVVEAEIDGEVRGTITVQNGTFGGPTAVDRKLVVHGTADEDGETDVHFYLTGDEIARTQATESLRWESGTVTELHLTAEVQSDDAADDAPAAPGGGPGGAPGGGGATPTEQPVETPTEEPTPTPVEESTPTPTEEPTPAEESTPTPTSTEEPTPTAESAATPTDQPGATPTAVEPDTPTEAPPDPLTEIEQPGFTALTTIVVLLLSLLVLGQRRAD